MKIISHRGYWKTVEEKNSVAAFKRSFTRGYGTETDVRDLAGTLVISHDMPRGGELPFADFLAMVGDPELPLAINIKADGLAASVRAAMEAAGHRNWFVFDMSVPDMLGQLRQGNPVYTRVSEYEAPVLAERAAGVWLDAFVEDEWRLKRLPEYLEQGMVCLVSPELHGRPYITFWTKLKAMALHNGDNMILCTDVPEEATAFFEE